MHVSLVRLMTLSVIMSLVSTAIAQKQNSGVASNAATTPVPRGGKWMERHESMNARVKKGNVDLIFVGDSITHGWENYYGKPVWDKYYGHRNAVNLGIGGDQTSQVLWRLENCNIDGISPKLAVVMIGTNNAGAGQSPEQIAAGVKAVVETLRKKLPKTKILLVAIFPRGADANDGLRKRNEGANAIISKLADKKRKIFYLNINSKFLSPDGKLTKDIMPDLLHPFTKGYTIWAEAMEPTIRKMMGE